VTQHSPTRHSLVALLCIAAVGAAGVAAAQTAERPGMGLLLEIAENVYPAELVMRHAEDIGLDEAQRAAVTAEMQSFQSDLVPLKWEIHERGRELNELLEPARIDEKQALEQAARVMDLEQKIKTRHLAMLVRVKNLLSGEQQEILDGQRLLPRLGEFRERLRERWRGRAEP
jgi:Spy/CpxP family protein refolding chaperone